MIRRELVEGSGCVSASERYRRNAPQGIHSVQHFYTLQHLKWVKLLLLFGCGGLSTQQDHYSFAEWVIKYAMWG